MRISEPERKTAMAEMRKVKAEKTETEKTEAEKAEAEKVRVNKAADSSGKSQRRCRNLSDVSVRSSRKGRTQQSKKASLIEKGDGDSEMKKASKIFKID